MERWNGYKFNKNTFVNRATSTNPLAKLSYKELQEVAFDLHLPANLQHKVLLAVIIAKNADRDDIVNIIVNTSRRKREKSTSEIEVYSTRQIQAPSFSISHLSQNDNVPASNNLEDTVIIEFLDDPMSSTILTNLTHDQKSEQTTNFHNDIENQNVQDCPSYPDSNINNMLNLASSETDLSKDSIGGHRSDGSELRFRTPSSSFDSGFTSFTSGDCGLENVDLHQFLNDSFQVEDNQGSVLIELEDPAEISIVEVLETLSKNQ